MNIFSKVSTNEYNNKLEQIIEKKSFSSTVKNLLLSMIYKIETGYTDYSEVKVDAEDKNDFMEKILYIIGNECNKIEVVTPKTEKSKPLDEIQDNYIINLDKGSILVYANEKDLLSSIIDIDNKTKKMRFKEKEEVADFEKVEKDYICIAIKDLFEKGNIMDYSEIIRDFNGWSWNTNTKDMEDLVFNVIFQDLLLLLGKDITKNALEIFEIDKYKKSNNQTNDIEKIEYDANSINLGFLNIQRIDDKSDNKEKEEREEREEKIKEAERINIAESTTEEIIENYKRTIYRILEKPYSLKRIENLARSIYIVIVLEEMRKDKSYKETINARFQYLVENIEKMNNKKEFLNTITQNKKALNEEIKNIDTMLNDKEKIQKEYNKRNKDLKNENKIFSISHLANIIEKEREEKFKELRRLNKLIEPLEYVKEKEKLENELDFLEEVLSIEKNKEIEEVLENIQIEFLDCFKIQIEQANEKELMIDLIYKLRYFNHLAISNTRETVNIPKVKEKEIEIINMLIDKSIYLKVIENISDSVSLCYNILKYLFESRIIDLEQINLKIIKINEEKGQNKKEKIYEIQIKMYDASEAENAYKETINNLSMLNIKLNKKIKLFL